MLCQIFYYGDKKKPDTRTRTSSSKKPEIAFLDLNTVEQATLEEGEEFIPPPPPDEQQSRSLKINPQPLAAFVLPILFFNLSANQNQSDHIFMGNITQNCEPDKSITPTVEHIGYLIGWVSAFVYLNSRIPQVLKNYKRKSVEGLSLIMFFCAIMGNLTYGMGVILKDSSPTALKKSLPWLVGSLGTLSFDFFILLQFRFYSNNVSKTKTKTKRANDGYNYEAIGDRDNGDEHDEDIFPPTPRRGLFGLKSWATSPFTKPVDHGYAVLDISPRQSLLRNHHTVSNIDTDSDDGEQRFRADSL